MSTTILDIILFVSLVGFITLVIFAMPAPYWAKLQLALLTVLLIK